MQLWEKTELTPISFSKAVQKKKKDLLQLHLQSNTEPLNNMKRILFL